MSLKSFLQLLENQVDHKAVNSVWNRATQESVLYSLLRPTQDLALSYPDDNSGKMLTVVRHAADDIVAVDEANPHLRRKLSRQDIVIYEPNWAMLRKQIADALSLQTSRTSIAERAEVFQVGNWEPKKAASFPVYLAICRSSGDLRKCLHQLMITCTKDSAIILTPTRQCWQDEMADELKSRNMLLVALDEALAIHDNQLVSSEQWLEYLNAFCAMVKLKLPGNYQNKRPLPIRAKKAANIEKLEKALEAHLLTARDHAHAMVDRGEAPELLPRPQQKFLAKQLGISETAVSRCINDKRATKLKILWDAADDLEAVMKYQKRR
ncbi:MAG: hypothetical protein JW936_03855 [Sedimentisphaerales bacterium]|nr:hypothetical protein [Sedimentisphaerales bacterium]